jgi:hypothetical protein
VTYDSDLMEQRANEVCEICKTRRATEWHHCIVHRMKGVPELDMQHVCKPCHDGTANRYENRRKFFMEQFYRYGNEFIDWYETLPLVAVKEFAAEREQINGREFEEERTG